MCDRMTVIELITKESLSRYLSLLIDPGSRGLLLQPLTGEESKAEGKAAGLRSSSQEFRLVSGLSACKTSRVTDEDPGLS